MHISNVMYIDEYWGALSFNFIQNASNRILFVMPVPGLEAYRLEQFQIQEALKP